MKEGGYDEHDWFYIETSNGLVLDITGGLPGGKLTIFAKHGGANQLWRFEKGCLLSKLGLVADVKSGNRNSGAEIIASHKHGDINQLWELHGNEISSKMNGLVMTVNGNLRSGTAVVLMNTSFTDAQTWYWYSL